MSAVTPPSLRLAETAAPGTADFDSFLPTVPDRVRGNLTGLLAELKASGSVDDLFLSAATYALLSDEAHHIRPALSYVTALACGIGPEEVDNYATGMELYHNMAVTFDDLPAHDGSDMRRHQPTLWRTFDVATAEMTAGLMTNWADGLVADADMKHGLGRRLSKYVTTGLGRLAAGQRKDLALKGRSDDEVSPEELDEIAALKTATAVEMSIVGVAMVKRLPKPVINRLQGYSHYYGIAFQIQDDLQDSSKGPDGSGKTHDLDKKNRRPNYASVLGAEGAQARFEDYATRATTVRLPTTLDMTGFEKIITHLAYPDKHT